MLWRMMIAKEYQGKGYGKQAMEAVIAYLLRRTNAEELRTSCMPEGFSLRMGFQANGELLDDEAVLVLPLTQR